MKFQSAAAAESASLVQGHDTDQWEGRAKDKKWKRVQSERRRRNAKKHQCWHLKKAKWSKLNVIYQTTDSILKIYLSYKAK